MLGGVKKNWKCLSQFFSLSCFGEIEIVKNNFCKSILYLLICTCCKCALWHSVVSDQHTTGFPVQDVGGGLVVGEGDTQWYNGHMVQLKKIWYDDKKTLTDIELLFVTDKRMQPLNPISWWGTFLSPPFAKS